MKKIVPLLATTMLFAVSAAFAAEVNVPPSGGGADITVYNSDLALVREKRSFKMPASVAQLAFTGVSGQMQPETALLDVVKGDPIKITEQNFNFNTISPQALLEQSVGKEVSVVTTILNTGRDNVVKARVLSADGPVLEIDGKIHTGLQGRIVFDSLPPGLSATPTLLLNVTGAANKDTDAEFSYLTGGLSWRADYVMNYDADAARMGLTAWATLTNTTGIDFNDARLKLVAGDISRVYASRPMAKEMRAMAAPAAPMADGVAEGELEGSQIYTIAKPTTVADKQTKQLALLSAQGVGVTRELVVRSNQPYFYGNPMRGQIPEIKASIELMFKNETASKLGVPLPAGVIRVYGMDDKGAAQFIGESNIGHKAAGSDVRLTVGRDFDISVQREQTTFVHASDAVNLSVWQVTIKNAKARPVKVRLVEAMPASWDITKESQPHKNANAANAEWLLDVPAKGQTVLEYNVKSAP